MTATGEIVGVGDLGTQPRQVLAKLRAALAAAAAILAHVLRWTILAVAAVPLPEGTRWPA